MIRRRRPQTAAPLEPAEPTLAAIRRAEEAAAARLAAETADRTDVDAAHRQADEILAAAARRATERAAARRQAVRAALDEQAGRERAAGAARAGRLRHDALDRREEAVRLAVALVLTGEAATCSSR